jgi:cytochrome c-type protein NapB
VGENKMSHLNSIAVYLAVFFAAMTSSQATQPIAADSMGLSKGSVFETPTPKAYQSNGAQPGENKLLPLAYSGAPPQIPHDINGYLPITAKNNMCIDCHNEPGQWGKKLEKGSPTPIPKSHYTDRRRAPNKVTDHLINARFNCNQCHVPQSDATPLVKNTFSSQSR